MGPKLFLYFGRAHIYLSHYSPTQDVWLSTKGYKIHRRKKKTHSQEPDSDMTQTLELSDREFRITMINMLKALVEKSNKHA